ncbi:right-handed parallel beta-helix repeat-containing protein, partial [Patescibacteria group bacterium]
MSASAAIIHVPSEQGTIQAGIDVAVSGDTVLVADGTYSGAGNKNLDFNGKAITVQSENGAEGCVIDCENEGRGFYFHSGETSSSVLDGLTIRNGNANGSYPHNRGGGIYCADFSSAIVINCVIENSSALSNGGGICISNNSVLEILNSTINGNSTGEYGGGLACTDSSEISISESIISGNNGGGVYCANSQLEINVSSIIENSSNGIYTYYSHSSVIRSSYVDSNTGNGIKSRYSSTQISDTTITNNRNGIYFDGSTIPSFLNNCLIANNSDTSGGGITCFVSSPTINNCAIIDNTASSYEGGGLYVVESESSINNCIITGNIASHGGGIYLHGSAPSIANCTFSNNTSHDHGSAIFM